MTTNWTRAHLTAIGSPAPAAPVIGRGDLPAPLPGLDLWDWWPVTDRAGAPAEVEGGMLVMALAAPRMPDPDARHGAARIRLLHRRGNSWTDCGDLLPDGFAPGSREWSGSAVLDPATGMVTLYFTAAGRRGEAEPSFGQRLFETRGRLDGLTVTDWTAPAECVVPDGQWYETEMTGGGGIGTIKAFRDPAWFEDPADGRAHLVFAASCAGSASPWSGAVGHAVQDGTGWRLAPPILAADGLNNELERPHLVRHDGLYYLFWSTQRKVFADDIPAGPTGLYGMVAPSLDGPYRPLNGSGLVFGNPDVAPAQAYSWLVLPDLTVESFADLVGLAQSPRDVAEARAHFGGVPAPTLRLRLSGDRASLA